MRNIPLDRTAEANHVVAKTIERSGWGLFFIWVGITFLANLGWGVGLLGVGIIMLGAQAAQTSFGLSLDGFGLVLGVCFAGAGLSRLFHMPLDESPISAWLVPSLFIAAGVAALVSAWRHRQGA
jgi:hypothetical protein